MNYQEKCCDCGESKNLDQMDRLRTDICKNCFVIRGRVIEALKSGAMSSLDFQNYQRGGLRTKRLIKMGYVYLVKMPKEPPAPAAEKER